MVETMWMVRAGEGGYLIEEFVDGGVIAIGWHKLGDLSEVNSQEKIRELYNHKYPDEKPAKVPNAVAMIYKFCFALEKDQKVVTYDSQNREYLIGSITSNYDYDTNKIADYPHLRKVNWLPDRISRDALSVSSRNSLGGIQTLFSVNEEVSAE